MTDDDQPLYQPGSEQAIQHYRQQVIDRRPMQMPSRFPAQKKKPKYEFVPESEMTESPHRGTAQSPKGKVIEMAGIDSLLGDNAADYLEQQIAALEQQIQEAQGQVKKLRAIRRALAVTHEPKPSVRFTEEEEQRIVDVVRGKAMLAKEIQSKTGINYMRIGKIVTRSARLQKSGKFITLARGVK